MKQDIPQPTAQDIREAFAPKVLPAADGSQIAVADLQKWVRRLRDLFHLPIPEQKGSDESQWWTGYNNALTDLERFISPRSENTEPSDRHE